MGVQTLRYRESGISAQAPTRSATVDVLSGTPSRAQGSAWRLGKLLLGLPYALATVSQASKLLG